MKVGDLVELSAYGKQLKLNKECLNKVGLIVALHHDRFTVVWCGEPKAVVHQIRKDLKHVNR